jgi:hypothetical protein
MSEGFTRLAVGQCQLQTLRWARFPCIIMYFFCGQRRRLRYRKEGSGSVTARGPKSRVSREATPERIGSKPKGIAMWGSLRSQVVETDRHPNDGTGRPLG